MVSTFLITKAQLLANEQSHALIRGIPRYLWERMQTRLMVANTNHLATEGYTLDNLYKVAVYVIMVDSPNSHSSLYTGPRTKHGDFALLSSKHLCPSSHFATRTQSRGSDYYVQKTGPNNYSCHEREVNRSHFA